MTESSEKKGGCLCGAVTFTAKQASNHVDACHCTMCRQWGGGPYMELDCGTDVVFEGRENISVYNSSDWAERGFCKHCGSHLFYRLKESQAHMVPVGLFENVGELTFRKQVFIDEKPSYYHFSEDTQNLTGAELFAMYAPPNS